MEEVRILEGEEDNNGGEQVRKILEAAKKGRRQQKKGEGSNGQILTGSAGCKQVRYTTGKYMSKVVLLVVN